MKQLTAVMAFIFISALGANLLAESETYEKAVQNVQNELNTLDISLADLTKTLEAVVVEKQRLKARISYTRSGKLVTGSRVYKLKPEQPILDRFVSDWTLKNKFVPLQMGQVTMYLRRPEFGKLTNTLRIRAERNEAKLVSRLIKAKKREGNYDEEKDLPVIKKLVATVSVQNTRKADISQYLEDQDLLDTLLKLRTKYLRQPVRLSKTVLEMVDDQGTKWPDRMLRKALFFVPVKKYFWQLVKKIESREGRRMNWIIPADRWPSNPDFLDMLFKLSEKFANKPTSLSRAIFSYVEKNLADLSENDLELALHFVPQSKYANKIWRLFTKEKMPLPMLGFQPTGTERFSLSSQNESRFVSMNQTLVGRWANNRRGSSGADRYYDANGQLILLRETNSQTGETWLTPTSHTVVAGSNGAFSYSFFDGAGRPLGFARKSQITNMLVYYDLEANVIGISRPMTSTANTVVYGGEFYAIFK
jgi:hypothetical protein